MGFCMLVMQRMFEVAVLHLVLMLLRARLRDTLNVSVGEQTSLPL